MKVKKCQCEISNVNPRKEKSDDGDILASDVSVEFAVQRQIVDELFPVAGFTDQFFNGEDTRLEVVYPIVYSHKVEDLKVTLYIGRTPMVFEGAKIARNMKLTPQVGGYVKVEAKLQVYPTEAQSGKLDKAVKEMIDLEIAPMTADLMDAA
jgi:hypothetical protein